MARVLPSAITVLFIAIIFYAVMALLADGQQVWQALLHVEPSLWLLILSLSLANYALRFLRWTYYIAHLSAQRLPLVKHALIYLAGFSLTTTPGKAGEAMRSLYLQQLGISHQHSLSALLVERIVDLMAVLVMASASFFVLFQQDQGAYLAAAVAVLLIVALIALIKMPKQALLQSAWLARLPEKIYRLVVFICHTLEAAKTLLSLRCLLWALLLGLLAWGFEAYGLYWVMASYQLAQSSILLALAIYGAAILLGTLSMSPAGIGASELIMASLLVLAGFSMPHAIAITYICRMATLWFAVVVGLLSLLCLWVLGLKPQLSVEGSVNAR